MAHREHRLPASLPILKAHELYEWAMDQPVERPPDRSLLLAYIRFRNRRTGLAWPSLEKLQEVTLYDRKTIIAARQRLAGRGYMELAGRHGDHGRGVNVYLIRGPEHSTLAAVDIQAPECRKRDSRAQAEVPKTTRQSAASGTSGSTENGTQNLEREPADEREGARGAPLSDWKPSPEDLRRASEARPGLDMVWVAEKFVAHHAGSRRPASVWRRLWAEWVQGEREAAAAMQQRAQPRNWWESLRATREHGEQLGVKFEAGDTAAMVTAKVYVAAGDGPWRRKVDPLVAQYMQEINRQSEAAA